MLENNVNNKNYINILNLLIEKSDQSVLDISQSLNISQPTISKNLDLLIEKKLVLMSGTLTNTGGRNAKVYSPNLNQFFSVGVSVTSEKISLVILNLKMVTVFYDSIKIKFQKSNSYYKKLSSFIDSSIKNLKLSKNNIVGISIALPALVDPYNQIVTYGGILNIEYLKVDEIAKFINYPATIVHDSKAAAYTETRNISEDNFFFYIMINDTVGGGLIINNKIIEGYQNKSAEIGHIKLVIDGKDCYCGGRGCFDAYCSTKNLTKITNGDLEAFFQLLDSGDSYANEIWETYTDYLAIGIHDISMLLDCKIIIGGMLGKYIDRYIEIIKCKINDLYPFEGYLDNIESSTCKFETVAVGSAMMVMDDYINNL